MNSPDVIEILKTFKNTKFIFGDSKSKVDAINRDMELYNDAVKFRDNLFYEKKMPGFTKFLGNKFATATRILLNKLVNKTY